jgi:hypothetical protein
MSNIITKSTGYQDNRISESSPKKTKSKSSDRSGTKRSSNRSQSVPGAKGRFQDCQVPVSESFRTKSLRDFTEYFRRTISEGNQLFLVTSTYKAVYSIWNANNQFRSLYQALQIHVLPPFHSPEAEPSGKLIAWAFVDVPGSKHKGSATVSRTSPSDSFHHHAIFIVPKPLVPRFRALCAPAKGADGALDPRKHQWLPGCLKTFHVKAVKPSKKDVRKTVDYASLNRPGNPGG